MKWLDDLVNSMDMILSKLWEIVKDRESWSASVHRVPKSQRFVFQRDLFFNDFKTLAFENYDATKKKVT